MTAVYCNSCCSTGHVCENHSARPWDCSCKRTCDCGGAGMPCPDCCSPIPEDGSVSIGMAFIPDWLRPNG